MKPTPPASPSPSRRQVLAAGAAGAAAAAAAFTIVPAAAVRGAAANSRVTLGVVGLGGRGRWIADLFAKHGGYQITSVADYFPAVANDAGEGLGVPKERRFSGLLGYRRLIDSKVDAVALETPPWFFPQHAAAAVNAGCHVYMAKPVACDVPGTLSILEAGRRATANRKVFLVDFQVRTDPWAIEAIASIHAGSMGRLCMLSSYYTDEGFPDPPKGRTIENRLQRLIWVNDDDLGGGYLVNAGIHAMDVALWIANATPTACVGIARRTRKEANGDSDDVFSLSYEFPGGLVLNHRGEHVGNLHGFTAGCHAFGHGAYAEVNYEGRTWLRGGPKQVKGGEVKGLYEAGAVRNIATFHRNVTEGITDNPTLVPSVNATLATIMGRDAGKSGRRLTWDELLKDTRKLEVDLSGLVQ